MLNSLHTIATCRNLLRVALEYHTFIEGNETFENEFILNGKVQRNLPVCASSVAHRQQHHLPVPVRQPNITVKAMKEAVNTLVSSQHRPEQQIKQNFTSVAGLPSSLDATEFISGISMF